MKPESSSGPDWTTAVNALLDKLRADNVTIATLQITKWKLDGKRSREFRQAHGIHGPRDLNVAALEALVRECLADGCSAETAHGYLTTHQRLLRFCRERGWPVDRRALTMKGPRRPKRAVRTLSADDEHRLLAACQSPRDRVLIRLMLATGLRRGEVSNLDLDDIEALPGQYPIVRVRQGKMRQDRSVPLDPDVLTDLQEYIRKHRPTTESRALFLQSTRRGGDFERLLGNGIHSIFERLRRQTGIPVYPHGCRHTAATRWASAGMNASQLQKALGHSTFQMSAKYVAQAGVDLIAAFDVMRKQKVTTETQPLIAEFAKHRERKDMLAFAEGIVRSLMEQGALPCDHPFNALFKPRLEDIEVVPVVGTWADRRAHSRGAMPRRPRRRSVTTEARS